uniref:F-box domain-containing protein n=1 Tax=Caenorhabditis tropicalis TaxID=1561998 RepID=A0A1I7TUJ0_9PELO
MLVDSLLKLCSKKAAKYLLEDRYKHLDFTLQPPLSDQVFREVSLKDKNYSDIITQETGVKLNLTKFTHFPYKVTLKAIESLHLHDLESLVLGRSGFSDLLEYIIITEERSYVDIVRLLKTCLTENSRKNLKHLELGFCNFYPDGWIESIGELVPNLLSFKCDVFPKKVDKAFPNLVHLSFRDDSAISENFDEIGRLKNLQTLCIPWRLFSSPEQLKGILELPNLRVLDISSATGFYENLLLCDGKFQNLKHLDCYGSVDLTETVLRTIVERNPSLEEIIAHDTDSEFVDFSDLGIKVSNLATVSSTMDSLDYIMHYNYRYLWWEETTKDCFERLKERLENGMAGLFDEDVFLELMMKAFHRGTEEVTQCLIAFFKHLFPGKSIKEVLRHLDAQPKTPVLAKQRWAAQIVSYYYEDMGKKRRLKDPF